MLHYIYGKQLELFPKLRHSMLTARANLFRERLGWDVHVDKQGYEKDDYDSLNPLYVIWSMPDGTHGGSLRLMPSTGRIMLNEHFSRLISGTKVSDPSVWECTRFCVSARQQSRIAAALVLGVCEIAEGLGMRSLVAVFNAPMRRLYKQLGIQPSILASDPKTPGNVSAGSWELPEVDYARLLERAQLNQYQIQHWARHNHITKYKPQIDYAA